MVCAFFPKIRRKALGRFLFLALIPMVWNGCAPKGGTKPWEEGRSVENLWDKKSTGPGSNGENIFEKGLDELHGEEKVDWGWIHLDVFRERDFERGSDWEELPHGWKKAMKKRPLLDQELEDHPAIEQYAMELRKNWEKRGAIPLTRASKYLPRMREIFRDEGLPEDLVYLAFVESGFNPWVSSPGKCVGIWQLTEGTARRYGLRIDSFVDERRDPERSTRAAARYLRDLYENFRSWDLAIAAYNAGEMTIARSLEEEGAQSFWELYSKNRLRKATREFVPRVFAAIRVAKEQEETLGFEEEEDETRWRFDKVRISQMVDLETLASLIGCSKEELKSLNPQLKTSTLRPSNEGLEMRVPEGKGEELRRLLMERGHMVHLRKGGGQTSQEAGSMSRKPDPRHANPKGQNGLTKTHVVKKGESLWAIARRYGVAVEDLMRWNGLKGFLVRPGEKLLVRAP